MPLRALGYITSALSVAGECLPKAQVQLVHTVHTAQRVNGLDPREPIEQAKRLAHMSRLALGQDPNLTHLADPKKAPRIDEQAIAVALETLPGHAAERLARAGNGKGRTLSYIAGHLLMHDTQAELTRLSEDEAEPIAPAIIVSIGAQSERPFYLARMACRDEQTALPKPVGATGQLFTRHVLPPYQMCREGEPHINDLSMTYPLRRPLEWAADPLKDVEHPNSGVRRDLQYLGNYLAAREDPEPRRLQDPIADLQRLQGESNA